MFLLHKTQIEKFSSKPQILQPKKQWSGLLAWHVVGLELKTEIIALACAHRVLATVGKFLSKLQYP